MLHIFHGNNTTEVRAQAHTHAAETARSRGATLVSIDADAYTPQLVRELAERASLFGESFVYLFDTPSERAEFETELAELSEMFAADQERVFYILEPARNEAALTKRYPGPQVTFHKYANAAAQAQFNVFALGDALSRKDKRGLWTLFHTALAHGYSAEQIGAQLFWQLKLLRLASLVSRAHDAGVSEYPFRKAVEAQRHFQAGELTEVRRSFLAAYRRARRGEYTLAAALELWILSL